MAGRIEPATVQGTVRLALACRTPSDALGANRWQNRLKFRDVACGSRPAQVTLNYGASSPSPVLPLKRERPELVKLFV